MKKEKKRRKSGGFAGTLLEMGLFILAVLVLVLLLSKFVVERVNVVNHSMEPTLVSGDSVMIDKISYRFHEPKRFDIIVFKQKGTSEELIKRVIGLPHDTVKIENGKIFINDEEIKDVKGLDPPEYAGIASHSIKLASDECFVMGDNRAESIDSRYEQIGLVPLSRITGRMFLRVLPAEKFGFF